MLQLIGNSLKLKIKTPVVVFWPLVFPLIMATFFYFALNDIDNGNFESTPVAIVEVKGEEDYLKAEAFNEFLEGIEKDSEKEPLLIAKYVDEEKAVSMLEGKEVKGIFYIGKDIKLKLSGNGIGENILFSVYNRFNESLYTIKTIVEKNVEDHISTLPLEIQNEVRFDLEELTTSDMEKMLEAAKTNGIVIDTEFEETTEEMRMTFVEDYNFGGKTLKLSSEYFFALIGMACLYGGFVGLECTKVLKANLSKSALRCSVAPTNKMKLILSEMVSTIMIHFVNVIILLIYMRYILKISLTGNIPKMLVVVFAGCLIGISLGIFIGSIKTKSVDMKIGILLAVSMTMTFCAGLMNGNMKHLIEENIPFLNRINPAVLISDAMYCINVYDDPEKFSRSIFLLVCISVILIISAFVSVRRERYDSI